MRFFYYIPARIVSFKNKYTEFRDLCKESKTKNLLDQKKKNNKITLLKFKSTAEAM